MSENVPPAPPPSVRPFADCPDAPEDVRGWSRTPAWEVLDSALARLDPRGALTETRACLRATTAHDNAARASGVPPKITTPPAVHAALHAVLTTGPAPPAQEDDRVRAAAWFLTRALHSGALWFQCGHVIASAALEQNGASPSTWDNIVHSGRYERQDLIDAALPTAPGPGDRLLRLLLAAWRHDLVAAQHQSVPRTHSGLLLTPTIADWVVAAALALGPRLGPDGARWIGDSFARPIPVMVGSLAATHRAAVRSHADRIVLEGAASASNGPGRPRLL